MITNQSRTSLDIEHRQVEQLLRSIGSLGFIAGGMARYVTLRGQVPSGGTPAKRS